MNDPRQALEEQLRAIEAACRDYDGGDLNAAIRAAAAIRAIFHPIGTAPALLSKAGGTYARLSSSLPKAIDNDRIHHPMARVLVEMKTQGGLVFEASTGPLGLSVAPRSVPVLGKPSGFRHVQAPDWWKSEPAFVIEHSRLTRKDVVLWAAAPDQPGPDADKLPPLLESQRAGRPFGLKVATVYHVEIEAPFRDAGFAAVRQIGHELLNSPELLKLAAPAAGGR